MKEELELLLKNLKELKLSEIPGGTKEIKLVLEIIKATEEYLAFLNKAIK